MKLAKLNGNAEIFYSIQGEGKSLGKPSIFVRTSLCNLHCIWCDTDYTWNWKGTPFEHVHDQQEGYSKFTKSDYIEELSIEEVSERILSHSCLNVILTGGEPFLQQTDLTKLMTHLRAINSDFWFETETNGTLKPSSNFDSLINQYNVSVKLSNSNNDEKLRIKPEAMTFFASSEKANFKFVINAEADLSEVLDLIETYRIASGKIYLMPQGTSPEDLKSKQLWLVEICKEYGFNYTDRLHIHIYGNKRGV